MPFSQVPAASPIIRLRIGDLITSNFSTLGLSRMMGVGDPEFSYDTFGAGSDETKDLMGKVKEFEKKFLDLMNLKHRKTLDIIKEGKLTDDVLSTLESVAADLTSSYE